MKKTYIKPEIETVKFRFSEHIAASGQPSVCYETFGQVDYVAPAGCDTQVSTGWNLAH